MNNYHTFKEINDQINSWEKIFNIILRSNSEQKKYISFNNYDAIIFFGCGSSYNVSMSASFFTNSLLASNYSYAVPSSELIFNKNVYLNKNKKYLLVGFSRSGETTETINVVEKFKNNNIDTFIFTCSQENTLSKISNNHFYCIDAEEKSVVMTKSFSSMLLAYCLILTKFLNDRNLLNEFELLIDYMKNKFPELIKTLESYVNKNAFDKFFALGTGFNYGLANEADLKIKEMAQMTSSAYYILEFNHGPISLIDNKSLILILTFDNNLSNNVHFLLKNVSNIGSNIILIGKNNIKNNNIGNNIIQILNDDNFKNNMIKSFSNVPVFQLIAYFKTLNNGLNPDKPRNLKYTTKIDNI